MYQRLDNTIKNVIYNDLKTLNNTNPTNRYWYGYYIARVQQGNYYLKALKTQKADTVRTMIVNDYVKQLSNSDVLEYRTRTQNLFWQGVNSGVLSYIHTLMGIDYPLQIKLMKKYLKKQKEF